MTASPEMVGALQGRTPVETGHARSEVAKIRPQAEFLDEFRAAYEAFFGATPLWAGGQKKTDTSGFARPGGRHRTGCANSGERFELGDTKTSRNGWTVIVEFESGQLPLSNLLKYWPYLCGELQHKPPQPIVICHFSRWHSYGAYRDLWEWMLGRMQQDTNRLVDIQGRQFDHWSDDRTKRPGEIAASLRWIDAITTEGVR